MNEPRPRFGLSCVRHMLCGMALSIMAIAANGCGGDDGTAEVHGTVTIDGVPAAVGAMTFFPIDGQGGTAGAPIEDGKYTARVALGMNKVEVRVSKVVGEQRMYDAPDSPVKQILAEVLPPKYNDQSELTFDVQPGVNEQNYDLEL